MLLVATLLGTYPFLLKPHAGPRLTDAPARICRQINAQIVKRSGAGGFVVLPCRWIVKPTFL